MIASRCCLCVAGREKSDYEIERLAAHGKSLSPISECTCLYSGGLVNYAIAKTTKPIKKEIEYI